MKDGNKYRLYIDAYSPETIPMARLAEYMADFAEILGPTYKVHFDKLECGSTVIVSRVECEDDPKVWSRLSSLKVGEAAPDLQKAFQKLDDRLANDNAVGRILHEAGDGQMAQIIQLPGRTRPKPLAYGPIKQEGSLDGVLVSIGGTDRTVHLRLQNGNITYTNCDTNRALARELAKHLFEPIRIHGIGRWMREPSGEWTLKNFAIKSFDVLTPGSLSKAVEELRAVKGSAWSDIEDPLNALGNIRGDNDEMH